jgi:hypothetical protein
MPAETAATFFISLSRGSETNLVLKDLAPAVNEAEFIPFNENMGNTF